MSVATMERVKEIAPMMLLEEPVFEEMTSDESSRQEESEIPWEEMVSIAIEANERISTGKWVIGDMAVMATEAAGEDKEGRRKNLEQFALDTKIGIRSMTQYEWVSRKFAPGPIREISPALSWSHYRTVAALDEPTIWLEEAANNDWSVEKLKEQLAQAKETKDIEDGKPCDRPGCGGTLSLEPTERVSAQVYGHKMAFCCWACLGNITMNDLNTIRAGILDKPAPATATTFLINHPDPDKQEEISDEEWLLLRRQLERDYVWEKYKGLKKITLP